MKSGSSDSHHSGSHSSEAPRTRACQHRSTSGFHGTCSHTKTKSYPWRKIGVIGSEPTVRDVSKNQEVKGVSEPSVSPHDPGLVSADATQSSGKHLSDVSGTSPSREWKTLGRSQEFKKLVCVSGEPGQNRENTRTCSQLNTTGEEAGVRLAGASHQTVQTLV